MSKSHNPIAIYFAGGAGTNISFGLNVPTNEESCGIYPNISKVIVDTSSANVKGNEIELEERGIEVHLIPGVDGSGKNQRKAIADTAPHMRELMNKYKPSEFNIIVASAVGSGSSIMLQMLAELMRRNKTTVVILIASIGSSLEATNTMRTIRELTKASKRSNGMVCMSYYQNADVPEPGKPWQQRMTDVNASINAYIRALSIAMSGNIATLDSEDVINALNVRISHPEIEPQVIELIFGKTEDTDWDQYSGKVFTSMSCLRSPDNAPPPVTPLYETIGYYKSGVHLKSAALASQANDGTNTDGLKSISFITTASNIPAIYKDLNEVLDGYNEVKESLTVPTAIVIDADDDDLF